MKREGNGQTENVKNGYGKFAKQRNNFYVCSETGGKACEDTQILIISNHWR